MKTNLEITVRNTNVIENNPVRIKCPDCSGDRKKKNEKTLSVTQKDGKYLYQCWHCGISGGYSIDNYHKNFNSSDGSSAQAHQPPIVTNIKPIDTTNPTYLEFLKTRHFTPETCDNLDILFDTKGFNGSGMTDAIGFPYKQEGEIYAIKWRSIPKKGYTQEGSANTFFNLDRLNIERSIVIVEGELDVIALAEIGIDAVSVPNGAPMKISNVNNKIDPSEDKKFAYLYKAKDVLERCNKVILAVDNDNAGNVLCEELSRRIGKEKCLTVEFPQGCKDANDVLREHGGEILKEIITNATPIPIQGLNSANFYEDRLLDLYEGGQFRGISTGFESLDNLYTLSTGMLTTLTGIPSSGKSQFSTQLMLNTAINDDWKWCVCSFENPVEILIASLCEMYVGKTFWDESTNERMTKEERQEALKFIDEHFVFIDHMGGANSDIKSLISLAKTSCLRLGIRGFLIDPFNFVSLPKGETSETNQISRMLTDLQLFAKSSDIHIIFVAHPHKMYPDSNGDTQIPTGHHISGSASWFAKTDFGISIDRSNGEVTVVCWKCRFRWLGSLGSIKLGFDEINGRYLESSTLGGMFDPMGTNIQSTINDKTIDYGKEDDGTWLEF
mgnify:FL=1